MGNPKQFHINSGGKETHSFDAIVIGSGISGGWAAKELCEGGLKTLVLERGRNVEHIKDYPTANMNPWEFPHYLNNTKKDFDENPIQSTAYTEATRHFYVNDREHPYIQDTSFNWIRGYQVGGRSLTWGRQCYRMSDLDFEANGKDGIGVDWPIRYRDIAPWYDYVENYIGVSGKLEGLSQLPDGKFLPPMEMNCIETHFANSTRQQFKDRRVTIARVANVTKGWNGRGPCQYRNLCDRGCPFGGYFSSNSSTLPAAQRTGNLTLFDNSIVQEIIYDKEGRRASGVRVVNALTNKVTDYFAKIIFLNASTIPTASILLQSVSNEFPNGLGNSSNQIGHNIMDHFTGTGAQGMHEGFVDQYYAGRRPCGIYIPRFRNLLGTEKQDFVRGYGFQGTGSRLDWHDPGYVSGIEGFGEEFKRKSFGPGPWFLWIGAWGEVLPNHGNSVTLSTERRDKWGLPIPILHYEHDENERAMRKDVIVSAQEMLEHAGFKNIQTYSHEQPGGSAIHEMGTARMGRDPKTSVLGAHNQLHDIKNIFITDGSCMSSGGCQNPSLTYMALTARACAYAVDLYRKGDL